MDSLVGAVPLVLIPEFELGGTVLRTNIANHRERFESANDVAEIVRPATDEVAEPARNHGDVTSRPTIDQSFAYHGVVGRIVDPRTKREFDLRQFVLQVAKQDCYCRETECQLFLQMSLPLSQKYNQRPGSDE